MIFATHDNFFDGADKLRGIFDRRFADPGRALPERFVWDFWHVPGEYTHLRTPAYQYFPEKLYAQFHRYLVQWGRVNLGCHDVSPPWLSCYIEGCRQEAHQDVPHGPLAFVYSLTPWRGRRFKGGETFLKNPSARIEPRFNRLTLFNPAITHGVRKVTGTLDPREGRLVIHGWFVNPRPFWTGPLKPEEVREVIEDQLLSQLDASVKLGRGLISLRLNIARSGHVSRVETLVSTLRSGRVAHVRKLLKLVNELSFRRAAGARVLTLPLMID